MSVLSGSSTDFWQLQAFRRAYCANSAWVALNAFGLRLYQGHS